MLLLGGGGRFLAGGGRRGPSAVGGEVVLVSAREREKRPLSGSEGRMEDGGVLDGKELLEIRVLLVVRRRHREDL